MRREEANNNISYLKMVTNDNDAGMGSVNPAEEVQKVKSCTMR